MTETAAVRETEPMRDFRARQAFRPQRVPRQLQTQPPVTAGRRRTETMVLDNRFLMIGGPLIGLILIFASATFKGGGKRP